MSGSPALQALTRRHFFRSCAVGVGKVAIAAKVGDWIDPNAAVAVWLTAVVPSVHVAWARPLVPVVPLLGLRLPSLADQLIATFGTGLAN